MADKKEVEAKPTQIKKTGR